MQTKSIITPDTFFQHVIREKYPSIIKLLQKSLVPLLRKKDIFYEVFGSAVFLTYQDQEYLVTASHVITGETELFIPRKGEILGIQATYKTINGTGTRDFYDLAIFKN